MDFIKRLGSLLTISFVFLFLIIVIIRKNYSVKIKNYMKFLASKFIRPIDSDKIFSNDILKPSISFTSHNDKTQLHDGLPIFSTFKFNQNLNYQNEFVIYKIFLKQK